MSSGKTWIYPKGNEKALETFIKALKELHKEYDVVISNSFGSGTTYSPTKKENYYRTLPFALSSTLFTEEGNELFHEPNKYRKFGIFLFPDGIVEHKEEKEKKET